MNLFSRCYSITSAECKSAIWAYLSKMYSFRDHRKVLFVCNLLIAIASALFSAFTAWLSVLMYDPVHRTIWIGMLGLCILGAIFSTVCIVGMRGAHLVSLDLLLTYFWGTTVFVGPLLLGVVACMDFYTYTQVWFKHQWELPNFNGLHTLFCTKFTTEGNVPDPDAVAKCGAPLQNTDEWCMANFNGALNCKDFREAAITEAVLWCRFLTLIQGIIFIADLVLISGCLYLCYRIMKEQVITQSMNDVINYLLLLPIGACAGLSYYMWWLRGYNTQEIQYSWIADGFAYIAVAQALALPLGIIAGKLKSRVLLQFYICFAFLIAAALSANGAISIIFAGIIPQIFKPSLSQKDELACGKELTGCCCCNDPTAAERCPEWSKAEVIQLLTLDLKICGIIAFACGVYLIGAFIVAFLVRRNLLNYKTQYVGLGKSAGATEMTNNSSLASIGTSMHLLKTSLPFTRDRTSSLVSNQSSTNSARDREDAELGGDIELEDLTDHSGAPLEIRNGTA